MTRLIVGFFLVFLLFFGCTARPPAGDPRKTLRVQLQSEPITLDPALAEDGLSLRILSNTMEGLVGYDGAGTFQNRLAKTVEASPDGKIFRFVLQPGAKWSDGAPVKPEDFVTGIARSLRPGSGSKLAELLIQIKGARDYRAGKSKTLPGLRVEAGKLVIELEQGTPYFLQALSLPVAFPWRKEKTEFRVDGPVTGPYRITYHQTDKKYVLESNSYYWRGTVRIPMVELWVIRDETTGVHLFEQGKLDVLTRIPGVDFARLQGKGFVHTDPFAATYYLSFNTKKPPFDNRGWRQAVSSVIRKKELVAALQTGEAPARGWVPPGLEGFIPQDFPPMDAIAAVTQVKAVSAKTAPILATFDSSDRNRLAMEKIQQDVKEGLGLRLELQGQDWKTYVRQIQTDPAPIFRFGWMAPFLDPISHLQAFTTGNPNNNSRWSNAEYDRLVREIESLPSGPERERKIIKAQGILVDDEAAVVPIYHYVQNHAVNPRVRNFRVNTFGIVYFSELGLKSASEK